MNIRLIDVDSRIPNLALMQISAWHKQQGDTVGFDTPNPDKVYVSCIFSKNRSQALGIRTLYPDTEIIFGGSGIDLKSTLPPYMEKIKPDYNLYSAKYDIGFTTRGCIRNCPFCIVPQKEGKIKKWQHISEFHSPDHTLVKLLDNNIYALKDWFFENTDYAIENNLKLDITQGMDIRILTPEIAEQLKRIKWGGTIHFAFDTPGIADHVINGIQILKDAGIDCKHKVDFYVLVGYNTTPAEDLYRCNLLRSLGTGAFVMQYQKTPFTRRLARWANRRRLYWSCTFDDYHTTKHAGGDTM